MIGINQVGIVDEHTSKYRVFLFDGETRQLASFIHDRRQGPVQCLREAANAVQKADIEDMIELMERGKW